MEHLKGTVVSCGRYGCVVRLSDGRIANLPSSDASHAQVRRVVASKHRPQLPFIVAEKEGWLTVRLASDSLAPDQPQQDAAPKSRTQGTLDEKIIEYLRQTEEWDPKGAIASRAHDVKPARADRLLPFEMRARRQYRDSPKKPPRKKP